MSPEYASFFAAVLDREDVPVDLSDSPVTTPCVAHRTRRMNYELGIMISASHNPPSYNGIKIKENYGGSASDRVVRSITENLSDKEYAGLTWTLAFKGRRNDWGAAYTGELSNLLPENDIRTACDYLHGTAYPYFERILRAKGYGVTSLNESRDPLFGGMNPEPKPETMKDLVNRVKKEGFDIGFGFDGDGDRIAVVDEEGRLLSSQIILAVLAFDLLEQGKKGNIVKTVAGTYLADKLAERYGVKCRTVPIGFKNICPEILKGDVIVAGEESGGIGFGDYLPERDAIYTAVRILEIISRRGRKLGEIWDRIRGDFGDSVYLREDFGLEADYDRSQIIRMIGERMDMAKFPFRADISRMDGFRITAEDGRWLLLRPSGTEPMIRIYAEAPDRDSAEELISMGKKLVL